MSRTFAASRSIAWRSAFHPSTTPFLFACRYRRASRSRCIANVAGNSGTELAPAAAYIHLPFCRQRCHYCAFPVVVPSASRSSAAAAADEDGYISLLLAEIQAAGLNAAARVPLRSVYFGGGTPSLTSAAGLERILNALERTFGIADGCEITCEMDPATFDAEKASAFRGIGVNRASVGAQSFNDDLLRACGRTHSVADIYSALSELGKAGIENISLDLISGLPGQTMEVWSQSLMEVVRLRPPHVSIYDLTLEKGTKFGKQYSEGAAPLPAETESANMLILASELLRGSEYLHYEVSNYALGQHFQSLHNVAYWKGKLFYAFGLGSTSLTRIPTGEVIRFARPRGMSAYARYCRNLQNIHSGAEDDQIMSVMYPGCAPSSSEEVLEDTLINGLRLLIDGIDLTHLEENYGSVLVRDLVASVHNSGFEELGLVELIVCGDSPNSLRLTEKGAMVENSIVSTLLLGSIWKRDRMDKSRSRGSSMYTSHLNTASLWSRQRET